MWGILTAVLIGVFSAFGNFAPTKFIHNPEMSATPIYDEVGPDGSYNSDEWQKNSYATEDPAAKNEKEVYSVENIDVDRAPVALDAVGSDYEKTTKEEKELGERSMNTLTDE